MVSGQGALIRGCCMYTVALGGYVGFPVFRSCLLGFALEF